jgi:hypothetical protein
MLKDYLSNKDLFVIHALMADYNESGAPEDLLDECKQLSRSEQISLLEDLGVRIWDPPATILGQNPCAESESKVFSLISTAVEEIEKTGDHFENSVGDIAKAYYGQKSNYRRSGLVEKLLALIVGKKGAALAPVLQVLTVLSPLRSLEFFKRFQSDLEIPADVICGFIPQFHLWPSQNGEEFSALIHLASAYADDTYNMGLYSFCEALVKLDCSRLNCGAPPNRANFVMKGRLLASACQVSEEATSQVLERIRWFDREIATAVLQSVKERYHHSDSIQAQIVGLTKSTTNEQRFDSRDAVRQASIRNLVAQNPEKYSYELAVETPNDSVELSKTMTSLFEHPSESGAEMIEDLIRSHVKESRLEAKQGLFDPVSPTWYRLGYAYPELAYSLIEEGLISNHFRLEYIAKGMRHVNASLSKKVYQHLDKGADDDLLPLITDDRLPKDEFDVNPESSSGKVISRFGLDSEAKKAEWIKTNLYRTGFDLSYDMFFAADLACYWDSSIA